MIELRQLKHIILLSELKNFSKAAKAANISQPSFSISIKKAEEYYGQTLFTRNLKSIDLTAQGEVVTQMAKKMLFNFEKGQEELTNLVNIKSGLVRFGIDSYLSKKIIKEFLPSMNQKFPDIRYELAISPFPVLMERLFKGELDFIIMVYSTKNDFPEDMFYTKQMYVPKVAYFTRHNHPLTKLKQVSAINASKYPWVGNLVSPTWAQWALKVANISEEEMKKMFLIKIDDYDKTSDLVQDNNAIGGYIYDELLPLENEGKISIIDFKWDPPHPKNTGIIASLKTKQCSPACSQIIHELLEYSMQWKNDSV